MNDQGGPLKEIIEIKYNASKGQNHRMYCSYNSLSEDIKENQIIKYALHLCQKRPIADSLSEVSFFASAH